ncbi:DUF6567 family protein [Methylocaldum gracile]|uniref:DUF6567 family protein n=1 Tax=Methylocaldum sp. 0917 TaxID=2485163 RepID=UPI00105FFA47
MRVLMRFLLLIPFLFLLTGCPVPPVATGFPLAAPSAAGGTQITTVTQVTLSQPNFRLVKADVIGSSTGFRLLGLLTFKSPDYAEAITRLYENAGVSNGTAQFFVNLVYDQTSPYFILFSLPKITVRGDLVEFRDDRR